jgi:hypothetical protein
VELRCVLLGLVGCLPIGSKTEPATNPRVYGELDPAQKTQRHKREPA